jgi:FdrA protein
MIHLVSVHPNSYKDSVRLLEATRAILSSPGVEWGSAFMATPANLELLAKRGFDKQEAEATANDLLVAVRAADEDAAETAIAKASTLLFSSQEAADEEVQHAAPDLQSALKERPSINIAVISVPGAFATLEAQKALTAGLHVLLFSDNVPIGDEIALKRRAQELGRLVMGPGAGTAMLGGIGLGFANRVDSGPVGIVAAAGTGAQEVMSLLDRWGVGVSHVIGLGGRDLSPEVGGIMAEMAIRALDFDQNTRTILLVSKPPSREVAARVLRLPKKPMVASLIGLREKLASPSNVTVCNTLEQGARHMLALLDREEPDVVASLYDDLVEAVAKLTPNRKRLVGLFSGGTLCYEAMTIANDYIGPIYSNIPLDKRWTVSAAPVDAHICVDLGEEEYTKGRPHPMIDPEARMEYLRRQAQDPSIAAVLLDVVIGDGANANPASVLAPVAAEVVRSGAVVIVHVLGTERDPQGFHAQRGVFKQAGCIVTETAARAALASAALVLRDPSIARADLSARAYAVS